MQARAKYIVVQRTFLYVIIFEQLAFYWSLYSVNETKTKRNKTKGIGMIPNQWKQNRTDRNETIEIKKNETQQNKLNETNKI